MFNRKMVVTEDFKALISRAAKRDPDALEALVDQYADRVFGYLLRLIGDRTAAEDLAQEVFVRVVGKIDRYRHTGSFEGWLFRIATNLVRDRARTYRRRPMAESLDDVPEVDAAYHKAGRRSAGPEAGLDYSEECDALQRAISMLPEAERQVILLRHYGELAFQEISTLMEAPIGTTLARAHRGLAKLRQLVEKDS